ncbi:unnamed protein product, partial [Ectocarpus sp. 12 AP-2014]
FEPQSKDFQRQLVERYYANIDFTSEEAMQRFFVVLQEVFHDLQPAENRLPWQHASDLAEEHFGRLVRFLGRDGIEIIDGEIRVARGIVELPIPKGMSSVSEKAIQGHIQQAKRRMSEADYPAAITVCYTLVEAFLKAMLAKMDAKFKTDEGDIRKLYGILKGPLGLDPA